MKTLQAGLQFLRSKFIQSQQPRVLKKPLGKPRRSLHPVRRMVIEIPPHPVKAQSQPPSSFELQSSIQKLQQRTRAGWKQLECQAMHINQLSKDLEAALLDFKAIASQVNADWKTLQQIQHSSRQAIIHNICEYQMTQLPLVKYKPSGSFLLTSRAVDLFKAEREAILLAQVLRRRRQQPKAKR